MNAIREVRFNGKVPSIAYTDFSSIYLSWLLYGRDLEVARVHELSHIWLQHQRRKYDLWLSLKKIDNIIWNIATDLEIAKYIYTDYHNSQINTPRSFLQGGITTEHVASFKGEYAEDFYHELLEKRDLDKKEGKSFDADGNQWDNFEEDKQPEETPSLVSDVIKEAKEAFDKHISDTEAKKQAIDAQNTVNQFKPPKPSIASEIDRSFGRNKLTRVRSYKRPNKREGEFLLKGSVSRKKAAKITIYVDRSGSFDADKTVSATNKLSEILMKYRGKIDRDVIYFNNDLMVVDPLVGSGGTNYLCVAEDIRKNSSDLSVVITDDDTCQPFSFEITSRVLVIPIGCKTTDFATKIHATESCS